MVTCSASLVQPPSHCARDHCARDRCALLAPRQRQAAAGRKLGYFFSASSSSHHGLLPSWLGADGRLRRSIIYSRKGTSRGWRLVVEGAGPWCIVQPCSSLDHLIPARLLRKRA